MTNYSELIQTLLEQSARLPQSTDYFLSVYFPFGQNPDRNGQLRTQFKDFVQEELGRFEPLTQFKIERAKLVEDFYAISENFDYSKPGHVVFAKFNAQTESKGNWNYDLKDSFWQASLHLNVNKQIYIGRTFDLDQLLDNAHTDTQTVVLDLKQQSARVFSLRQNEWEQITSISNERIKMDEVYGEIMDQSSGKPSLGNMMNTGEDKGWIREEDRHFLADIALKIQELKLNPDYLLVFYSTKFTPLVEDARQKFQTGIKSKFEAHFVEKNLQLDTEIKAEAMEQILQLDVERKNRELTKAKEDYKLFISGWQEVVLAANNGQVETLFLRPSLTLPGWVENMAQAPETTPAAQVLHLDKQSNSMPAANIVPWMVKKVMALGGKVMVLGEDMFQGEADIMAKLRFAS